MLLPLRDKNPTRTTPLLNYALILANVGVFVHQVGLYLQSHRAAEAFIYRYGMVPSMLAVHHHPDSLVTLFTSMFMHGGVAHILGNMWFLYIFGDNIEDALGKPRYLFFYVASGLAAAIAQLVMDPTSAVPMIGASGAIAGVLGAYVRLFPQARVTTLVPHLPWWIIFPILYVPRDLPAFIPILFWFAIQLFSGWLSIGGPAEAGGVAFFAHIGGFIAGFLLIGLLRTTRNATRGFRPPARYGY